MKSRLKIVCSFIFFFFYFSKNIKAEDESEVIKKMTTQESEDKPSYSIKPSALNLGIDFFTPVYCYIKYGTSFNNYGLHSSIDFNRIFLDFDAGFLRYHKKQPFKLPEEFQLVKDAESAATKYDDSAFDVNFKLGFSYNFLHKNKDRNAIFAGLGYNFAFCKNRINGSLCGR